MAYATTPYLTAELPRVLPPQRLERVIDLGFIEFGRHRLNAPEMPHDLAEDYFTALITARRLSLECLSAEWPKREFRYLMSAIANLHGRGDFGLLLFNLDALCGDCPQCGKSVYPGIDTGADYL
jgi:hypothetical protein